MATQEKTVLTVLSTINASVDKVWESWNNPEDITNWCSPSPDWHTPTATNDLREGGRFSSRMEAKDGSMGFDFGGTYTTVKKNESIEYTIDDDRKVKITFTPDGDTTKVTEQFEAESINPIEMQQGGWQAILDSFKKYTEAK